KAEDGIRDRNVTGVQTCALPILDKETMRRSDKNEYKTVKKTKIRKRGIALLILLLLIIIIPIYIVFSYKSGLNTAKENGVETEQIGRASCRERVKIKRVGNT